MCEEGPLTNRKEHKWIALLKLPPVVLKVLRVKVIGIGEVLGIFQQRAQYRQYISALEDRSRETN